MGRTKIIKRIIWAIFLIYLCLFFIHKKYEHEIDLAWQSFYFAHFDHSLQNTVVQALNGAQGTYAVVILNMRTGQTYYYNEHQIFDSASLYKLWVMAATYQKMQNHTLDENKVLSSEVETLNKKYDISPDDADLTSGTITLPVKSALKQMITISHNYDALLLTEQVTLGGLDAFLHTNELNDSKVGVNGTEPTTSAYDIALFLQKLYDTQLANQHYTMEMIHLLKDQQLNNKLPKGLPKNIIIAHKTGELAEYSHDAGIVYTQKGNYIIVVMSKTPDQNKANDRIAQVSKAVYLYFLSQKIVN